MEFNSTVVFVTDINKARNFYVEILNQEVLHDFGRNIAFKSGLAIWETGENHPIKLKLNTSNNANRFELYFEDDDIFSIKEKLIDNNIKLFHDIIEEPWGQMTIRFFDLDNNLIEVGEPLHAFVKRHYNSGLTIEEVCKKTGINTKTVTELLKV